MKCPKCGYLGYEDSDRCRNCKYEFSLSTTTRPDLELRSAPELRPLEDLALIDSAMPPPAKGTVDGSLSIEPASVPAELPLFGAEDGDDTPLITRPSPPRPPLSVRRATPEVPRLRAEARISSPTPEKSTLTAPRRPATVDMPPKDAPARPAAPDVGEPPTAGVGCRATARSKAVVDFSRS